MKNKNIEPLATDLATIGERMAVIRNEAGHTVRSLANVASVDKFTVTRIEHGRNWPRLDVLQRMLSACGYRLLISKNSLEDEK